MYICIFILHIIVPIPHVQITIPEYQTFVDYETSGDTTSGDITSGESEDIIFANITIGDSLTLDCTVTAVRDISSSVNIIWTTGDRVVTRVDNIAADIKNNSAIYTDSIEISSLSAIDNGREYQCTVVINSSQPINSSDRITVNFPGEHNYVANYVCIILLSYCVHAK